MYVSATTDIFRLAGSKAAFTHFGLVIMFHSTVMAAHLLSVALLQGVLGQDTSVAPLYWSQIQASWLTADRTSVAPVAPNFLAQNSQRHPMSSPKGDQI